jgi:hypothetical protein
MTVCKHAAAKFILQLRSRKNGLLNVLAVRFRHHFPFALLKYKFLCEKCGIGISFEICFGNRTRIRRIVRVTTVNIYQRRPALFASSVFYYFLVSFPPDSGLRTIYFL